MKGKFSSDLKLPDLRDAANSLQQSITLHWKDIADRLESSNNAIQARDQELSVKEKELEKRHKVVKLKEIQCKKNFKELERLKQSASEELKLKDSEVEKRRKEVELKEIQCKKKLEELERMNQMVSETSKLKEFELEKQRKVVESKEVQRKKRLEELIRFKQSVSEASKLKEKELEKQEKEVELKAVEFIKKLEELERSKQIASEASKLKEKQVEKQRKDVELKEMQCKMKLEELERNKESVLKDLNIKQDHVEKQRKDLELKEKYLDEQFRVLRSNEMEKIDQQLKEIELEKKQLLEKEEKIDQKSKGFEMEKAKFMERLKELELKEKQLEVHISGFIRTLVRKKKPIEAIDFAHAFDLVSEFPPVPLLEDFLKFSRTGARKIGRKYKNVDAKIEALNQIIEDVKAALKCIQDHKIVSDFFPKRLKLQINVLEKQIAEMKTELPTPICKTWWHQQTGISAESRLTQQFSAPPYMAQQTLQGHMAQQPLQGRNPYMVGTSNPSSQQFFCTRKRPRFDTPVFESSQGPIARQFGYRDGYFDAPR